MQKILIANRGEIAVRIIRTARDQGYRTVAVYSDADADSLHVQAADQAVAIGGLTAAQSYLDTAKILAAAARTGADAIHPGYGFLAENADFARACSDAGIVFIGPDTDAIALMGCKRSAKQAVTDAGVPCIPGYQGADQSDEALLEAATETGFPLMVKAAKGGGGRGMRLVHTLSELPGMIRTARSEAESAFGDGELILEKAIINPRHIEIQIFTDRHGNMVHLFERDCSVQRRHQKIVEEAPSPFVDDALRARMGAAAIKAARSCNHVGAGTVEFLVDSDKNFYFLEMNTRLQVEHPVTEMITGLDLVEWQLRVAEGEPLPLTQDDISIEGHAVEVRLYAEDPRADFLPQTGTIQHWQPATITGCRTDSGISNGQRISPYYDPMIAKLICHSDSRAGALRKMALALETSPLLGVDNNKAFLVDIVRHQAFKEGEATTAFLENHLGDAPCRQQNSPSLTVLARAAVGFQASNRAQAPHWSSAASHWSRLLLDYAGQMYELMISARDGLFTVRHDDRQTSLQLAGRDGACWWLVEETVRTCCWMTTSGDRLWLDDGAGHYIFDNISHQPAVKAGTGGDGQVKAPMDGAVTAVLVAEGDRVTADQPLIILEAMKMEHALCAGIAGVVESISARAGDQVATRALLARVKADGEQEG